MLDVIKNSALLRAEFSLHIHISFICNKVDFILYKDYYTNLKFSYLHFFFLSHNFNWEREEKNGSNQNNT